jgi:hypothetical protein
MVNHCAQWIKRYDLQVVCLPRFQCRFTTVKTQVVLIDKTARGVVSVTASSVPNVPQVSALCEKTEIRRPQLSREGCRQIRERASIPGLSLGILPLLFIKLASGEAPYGAAMDHLRQL